MRNHEKPWETMGNQEIKKQQFYKSFKIKKIMSVEIGFSQGYFWLNSWVLANIIQLATQDFCDRFITYHIDPSRGLYDQMVRAARSIPANIAEGTSRKSTSVETEMRLVDVARASNDELFGDYFNFILRRTGYVWEVGNADREAVWQISLDNPQYGNSLHHDAAIHILKQKQKYDHWLKNEDACIVANTILVMCMRLNRMLESMMRQQLEEFRQKGGFTENMTQERLEARKSNPEAPKCPVCGEAMVKRVAKKGINSGNEFWSCGRYPNCRGTRPIAPKN